MITLLIKDSTLARMLYLEAKRQGFREEGDPSVIFVDLDHVTAPAAPPKRTTVVGICAAPEQLTDRQRQSVGAILSLPFSVTQLEQLLRHPPKERVNTPVREGQRLLWGNKSIPLSATECKLFDLLYENRHRTVTEAELRAVLGDSADRTNTLAVYLYRLRRKLGAEGALCIRTVRGKGCRWVEPSDPESR